ncbi:hypothetical protein [Streptomyces sp. NPDC005805]|uniref:hypothetical protein n=1 Tax=Streptomyces sp. NPDC005805 TaxID=3157068 RepID=UPI0033C6FA83
MGIEALVPGADLPVTHSAEFSHISCKRVKNSKGYETWRCWGESPQQVVDNGLANAAPHDPGSVAGRVKTELDYTPYDGGTVPERVRARQTPLLGGWVVPGAEPVLFGGFMMMVAGGCVWFASQPLGKALERRSARTFGYRSH